MNKVHGGFYKIRGPVHYDERIINNMMVLTIRFESSVIDGDVNV